MELKNYYFILGVSKSSSSEVIKKSYRKLALKWHPDKNNSPNANDKMADIIEAYEILSNSDKREIYNKLYEDAFEQTKMAIYRNSNSFEKSEKVDFEPSPDNKELFNRLQKWISEIKNRLSDLYDAALDTAESAGKTLQDLFFYFIVGIIFIACFLNVYHFLFGEKEVSILRFTLSSFAILIMLYFIYLSFKYDKSD